MRTTHASARKRWKDSCPRVACEGASTGGREPLPRIVPRSSHALDECGGLQAVLKRSVVLKKEGSAAGRAGRGLRRPAPGGRPASRASYRWFAHLRYRGSWPHRIAKTTWDADAHPGAPRRAHRSCASLSRPATRRTAPQERPARQPKADPEPGATPAASSDGAAVMEFVERTLEADPGVTNADLCAGAREIDPSVADLRPGSSTRGIPCK